MGVARGSPTPAFMSSSTTSKFRGLFVASQTPMKADGSLNEAGFAPYIKYLEDVMKVEGVFLNGTSGEAMSLSVAERQQVTAAWRQATKMVIIAHIGCNSLADGKALAVHAESVKVDAIALTPPTYYKPPSPEAYIDFAAEVAAAAPNTPFFFYHFQGITGFSFPLHRLFGKRAQRSRLSPAPSSPAWKWVI